MGSWLEHVFACDRCGERFTAKGGAARQPENWSAVQRAQPPLAVFEAARLLLCPDCTCDFERWFAAPSNVAAAGDGR